MRDNHDNAETMTVNNNNNEQILVDGSNIGLRGHTILPCDAIMLLNHI